MMEKVVQMKPDFRYPAPYLSTRNPIHDCERLDGNGWLVIPFDEPISCWFEICGE
jgi:hypothetical protein